MTRRLAHRPAWLTTAPWVLAALIGATGCRGHRPGQPDDGTTEQIGRTLLPATIVAGLHAVAGAQVTAQTHFSVRAATDNAESDHTPQDITTTTTLLMDAQGNFRFVEENDQDGGRTVVKVDDALMVKLRYGKPVQRPAREPEPAELLAQALGGPIGIWDLVQPHAAVATETPPRAQPESPGNGPAPVAPAGHRLITHTLRIAPAKATRTTPGEPPTGGGDLRAWRHTVRMETLDGQITLAQPTVSNQPAGTARDGSKNAADILVAAHITGRFSARQDTVPLVGSFEIHFRANDFGHGQAVTMPDEAAPLQLGQRTMPDEKALLENLPGRRNPADVTARP